MSQDQIFLAHASVYEKTQLQDSAFRLTKAPLRLRVAGQFNSLTTRVGTLRELKAAALR